MNERRPVQLPETIHHQLKKLAAEERTSIQALVLAALTEVYGISE